MFLCLTRRVFLDYKVQKNYLKSKLFVTISILKMIQTSLFFIIMQIIINILCLELLFLIILFLFTTINLRFG